MTSAQRWGLVCRKQLVPKKLLDQPGPCSARPPAQPLHPLLLISYGELHTQAHGRALGRRTHLPALLSKNVLNTGDQTKGENKILQDHGGAGWEVRGERNSLFPNFLVDCN